MKPIITLLALLACMASLAQAPNHGVTRRLITEDITSSVWYEGDATTGSWIDDEGLLDGHSASELIASWKTNQASQHQSCVRPAFREDLIPGLPSEITNRYPSRAATLIGDQRTSERVVEIVVPRDNRKTNSRYAPGFIQAKTTSTPFTNIVAGDNHTGCSTCDGIAKNHWLIYHPWHEGGLPYVPATERWTITTVGVRHTATIPGWPGELVKEEITSCTTNREVLKTDWVKVEPIKIQIISGGGGGGGDATITNTISESITNTFYITPSIKHTNKP